MVPDTEKAQNTAKNMLTRSVPNVASNMILSSMRPVFWDNVGLSKKAVKSDMIERQAAVLFLLCQGPQFNQI